MRIETGIAPIKPVYRASNYHQRNPQQPDYQKRYNSTIPPSEEPTIDFYA